MTYLASPGTLGLLQLPCFLVTHARWLLVHASMISLEQRRRMCHN